MNILRVSSPKGTCMVVVDDRDIIVDAAPLWKRFKGQKLTNLIDWLQGKGEWTNEVEVSGLGGEYV